MKFHVNLKDQTRRCMARIKCRYSSDHHFSTKEEAQDFIEHKSLEKNSKNLISTFKRLNKESKASTAETKDSLLFESPLSTSTGKSLLNWEKIVKGLVGSHGKAREEVFAPTLENFTKTNASGYTFFQREFTGKTGISMEHTIIGDPKILPLSGPNHNAVARGVIAPKGSTITTGLKNQHLVSYAVVESLNVETQEKEHIVFIDGISIPDDLKGKGIASELIDEIILAYPDLRIPETRSLTIDGKRLFENLQKSRGEKFKGYLNGRLQFDARESGKVNYIEE